jgi:hypothetical protein
MVMDASPGEFSFTSDDDDSVRDLQTKREQPS